MTNTVANTRTRAAATYDIDPAHSRAEFSVRHLMIASVKGSFRVASGHVTFDPEAPEATTGEIRLDVTTVDTSAPDRDAHLRSADFFDVENHPQMTYTITGARDYDGDSLVLEGDLAIRGVARPVALRVDVQGEAKDPWGKQRVGVEASTTLERAQWGLTWNQALETGGVLVGDKVKVAIDAQFVKRE